VLAQLISETQPNDFPRLPVREHEPVFVWLSRFADTAAEAKFTQLLARRSGWRDQAPESLWPALMRKPEVLRLSPTPRSRLAREGAGCPSFKGRLPDAWQIASTPDA
jgi:hypothetical protein